MKKFLFTTLFMSFQKMVTPVCLKLESNPNGHENFNGAMLGTVFDVTNPYSHDFPP